MFFRVDGRGLHGGDAGEDVEKLGVSRRWNGAEEEELVHCRRFECEEYVWVEARRSCMNAFRAETVVPC